MKSMKLVSSVPDMRYEHSEKQHQCTLDAVV